MEELKRIVLTLNARNLEFIGAFRFIVREKKIVKLYRAEVPQYCLYLSTETGDYGSTVTVSKRKYQQAKLGDFFGLCGVISNINRSDFILITEETNPETAIKQAVRTSRLKMAFLMMVLGLFFGAVLTFAYALKYLSWN
jgi:hypothetical protein